MSGTNVLTGTFSGTGVSSSFGPQRPQFNVSIWGTFVATVQVERSFDGGATWLAETALGTVDAYTAEASENFEEDEPGVLVRLNCTAYTSGTVNYRISQ